MRMGVCEEYNGHLQSIHFFQKIGLIYVPCSGPRITSARLAAALLEE